MLPRVRLLVALVVLVVGLVLPASATSPPPGEQSVIALEPPVEQRIEVLDPTDEQQVEAVDPADAQAVTGGTKNPGTRGLRTAGKVVVVVFAVVFSLAATAALLLV